MIRLILMCVLCWPVGAVADAVPDAEPAPSAFAVAADLPMLHDPPIDPPMQTVRLDPRCEALWLRALEREEFDLREKALESFTRAHAAGIDNFGDLSPSFLHALRQDPSPYVRIAAAKALVAFDHRDAAADMLRATRRHGPHQLAMVHAVDPALAKWGYQPARALWLERLEDRHEAPALARSAIRSLKQAGAAESVGALLACIADERTSLAVRLEAAHALGQLSQGGLAPAATELAAAKDAPHCLLAMVMLDGHRDAGAIALARELAAHADARVRSRALGLLRKIDPWIVTRDYAACLSDSDEQVRLQAVRALAESSSGSAEAIAALTHALGDGHSTIRAVAREALIRVGRDASSGASARASVHSALHEGARWQPLEQACRVAGALDMEDAANRLLVLLEHDRAEVRLAAAEALRRLRMPAVLPAMLERLEVLGPLALEAVDRPKAYERIGRESVQLLMAMGEQRYRPAAELLRSYLPKRSGYHPTARGAAVYALGKIHEDDLQEDLVDVLLGRVADNNPLDPEAPEVRRFAAIALARMGATQSVPTLRTFYEQENSTTSVGGACRWALMRLGTGDLPPLTPIVVKLDGFFLEPLP